MRSRLGYPLVLLILLLLFCVPLQAQIEPIANLKVVPIPLPGGDIFPSYGLYNQFFPGKTGFFGQLSFPRRSLSLRRIELSTGQGGTLVVVTAANQHLTIRKKRCGILGSARDHAPCARVCIGVEVV